MARYSEERKEAVLSKLLPPYNMTVAELARQEGISEPTLYTWRNKAKSEGRPVPGRKATSEQWCSGQIIPDTLLRISSAASGVKPRLNVCGRC